jgi:hypothetical protein
MTPPSVPPGPDGRPTTVTVAFYSWVIGAVLLTATGLLLLTWPPAAYKLVGGLLPVVGLSIGYLAGRTRKRHARFARATLALAMATVVFLALVLLFLPLPVGVVGILGLAVIALIAGSALSQRPASQRWHDPEAGR